MFWLKSGSSQAMKIAFGVAQFGRFGALYVEHFAGAFFAGVFLLEQFCRNVFAGVCLHECLCKSVVARAFVQEPLHRTSMYG